MGWVFLALLLIGILFWINCTRGMSLSDRVNIALDIIRSSQLSVADGFSDASQEDPELVGWMQDGHDSVMLFRSESGTEVREIVDVASDSFHPGLIIHYTNGRAVRTGGTTDVDDHVRDNADGLLRQVRRVVGASQTTSSTDTDGFRY